MDAKKQSVKAWQDVVLILLIVLLFTACGTNKDSRSTRGRAAYHAPVIHKHLLQVVHLPNNKSVSPPLFLNPSPSGDVVDNSNRPQLKPIHATRPKNENLNCPLNLELPTNQIQPWILFTNTSNVPFIIWPKGTGAIYPLPPVEVPPGGVVKALSETVYEKDSIASRMIIEVEGIAPMHAVSSDSPTFSPGSGQESPLLMNSKNSKQTNESKPEITVALIGATALVICALIKKIL